MKHTLQNDLMDKFLISAGQLAFVEDAGGTLAFLQRLHRIHRYVSNPIAHSRMNQEFDAIEDALRLLKCSCESLEFEFDGPKPVPDRALERGSLYCWILEIMDGFIEAYNKEPTLRVRYREGIGDSVIVCIDLSDRSTGVQVFHEKVV